MEETQKATQFATEPISLGYPKHVESFETFYYLGEHRTLRAVALLRFPQYVPDCPQGSPLFKSKFESFYTKIKRWAKAEDWDGWCIRKRLEESQKHEKESRQKLMSLDKTLRMYQSLVRQSLIVWADKVKTSLELRNALAQGDDGKVAMLATKDRFELRSSQDVRLFMELDMYLAKQLDQMPSLSPEEQEKLTEAEKERMDQVMESIRKRSIDQPYGGDGRERPTIKQP